MLVGGENVVVGGIAVVGGLGKVVIDYGIGECGGWSLLVGEIGVDG